MRSWVMRWFKREMRSVPPTTTPNHLTARYWVRQVEEGHAQPSTLGDDLYRVSKAYLDLRTLASAMSWPLRQELQSEVLKTPRRAQLENLLKVLKESENL